MDFFDHQDRAQRQTVFLIAVFIGGVVLTVVLINLLAYGLWSAYRFQAGQPAIAPLAWLTGSPGWQVSLAALLVIAGGSAVAYWQLRGGGRTVARWAGARPVAPDTTDPAERRLINVTEEMAIAAGTPPPELHVMPAEASINAFVAGYQPEAAVLVVSQGALEALERDELQGVVGHEFSHILNGDMRINVRLMAVLAGLVQIGQIGRWLVGSLRYRGLSSRRGSAAHLAIPAAGLGLMAVGYAGVLAGRIIKAAVSRQREFLADASAVQFTRNPDGIAAALYRIREHAGGARLAHRHAEDLAHLCFADSVALSAALATHPPLDERIRRVSPAFLTRARHRRRREESPEEAVARTRPDAFETVLSAPVALAGLAGRVTPEGLDYARQLYRHIPEAVREAVHRSAGARAFCYAQIMLDSGDQAQAVLDAVKREDPAARDELQALWPYCRQLDPQLRLPILELVIGVLRRLDERERLVWLDRIERLVATDGRTRLGEWVLLAQLRHHLGAGGGPVARRSLSRAGPALVTVLSILVHQHDDPVAAAATFERVLAPFDLPDKRLRPASEAGMAALGPALEELAGLAYFWRRSVIQACADVLRCDGAIAQPEYELIRTLADCLGCPLPPLREHEWQPGRGA